LFKNSINLQ